MNNFIEWINENIRVVILFSLGLVLLSFVIGLSIGLAKRKSQREKLLTIKQEQRVLNEKSILTKKEKTFLMPKPVIPPIGKGFSGYEFHFSQNDINIENLELIPIKLSELLKYSRIGLTPEIEPFQFSGEELEVLIYKNEIAEP